MTISEKANAVKLIKSQIKQAIIDKGVAVPANTAFTEYPSKIAQIEGGSEPVLESLTISPSTTSQTITPPTGVDGYDDISVNAVTSAIDNNITAGNIKKDVTILGITGSYEGGGTPDLQTKTFTASSTTPTLSTVTPDSGYDGLDEVGVDLSYIENRLSTTNGGGSASINYGPNREVVSGVYQIPSSNFTFSLPSDATDVGTSALYYAFQGCTGLTSVDLSSLTTVSGEQGFYYAFVRCSNLASADLSSLTTVSSLGGLYGAFRNCTSLTSVDLSSLTTVSGTGALCDTFYDCTGLTSVDLSSLTTVSGTQGLLHAFQNCRGLTSVDLSSLAKVSGQSAMNSAFRVCTSLTSLSFPSLTSTFNVPTSGTTYTDQFSYMLLGVTGCTVHFPSNLQSVIGNWSDVTSGFGGTNTTILFDLPATT